MRRTLPLLSLLAALAAPLGLLAPRPVCAGPVPPPIQPFLGGFTLANDQVIMVQGAVQLTVYQPTPPPISPQTPTPPPIRILTNLLNTRAVNQTTKQQYVGTGSWLFQDVVIPELTFFFTAGYRLQPQPPPIQEGQPNPPPIQPFSLRFEAVLHRDGSLQVHSITVLPPIPPGGDS